MNITLSVEDEVVRRARHTAQSMGTSLNQIIRDYLEELAGRSSAEDDVREVRELSARSGGHSRGWKFDRQEIHERS
jgi:hypothetical protein